MRRAVIYLRVSTLDQTTANQERELRESADRMGCEIGSTRIAASAVPRAAIGGCSTPRAGIGECSQAGCETASDSPCTH